MSLDKRRFNNTEHTSQEMGSTIVLGKKTVRIPKRKKCDRCPFYDIKFATRKDDHLQDCCEECWEELPELVCWCGFEFRGRWEMDCCPKCKHSPEDKQCPCGCLEDEDYQRERKEMRRKFDEMWKKLFADLKVE